MALEVYFLYLGFCIALSVAGGWEEWDRSIAEQRRQMKICLDAVDGPGLNLFAHTKEDCRQFFPPADEWPETIGVIAPPFILFGVWKIVVWIARGFAADQSSR